MFEPARRRDRSVISVIAVALALSAFSAAAQTTTQLAPEREYQRILTTAGSTDSARFHQLLDAHWRWVMREFPEFATDVGYPGRNDRWTDQSQAAIERRRAAQRLALQAARSISRPRLNVGDRVSYDLFVRDLEEEIEGYRFPAELLRVSARSGIHSSVVETLRRAPARTVADYEDMVGRLRAAPRAVDQNIALLEQGLARGITPPRVVLRDVPSQVRALIVDSAFSSPALRAFTEFPASFTAADRARLRLMAEDAFIVQFRPALQRFHDFLAQRYVPGARESLARNALPDGDAWYAYDVRRYTTTRMSPAEIHRLGHAEVGRIRMAMDSVIRATGFQGDFTAFVTFLRTDPRFFYSDSASLVQGYRDISKRIDPGLVKLFGRLPRLPYGVTTIPSYMAKSQTTAYYQQGSLDAARPGWYYVNTYDLKSRPKWEMEALSVHEAVPGHHLQIALAQEIEALPEFRRHGGYTAFVEGWALYSEGLGPELGLYTDPYSKFGQLTYEIWRAIRLVLDTGIHSMGWTRDQAIAYFRDNSAKTEHDIAQEVDRYIGWPGQALAYKLGQLKILELRREAERSLGQRFDIRRFHDEVLRHGAVPLDVLERTVRDWIVAEQQRPVSEATSR
jgi:uncharacterized protein (DUF885 family)